MLLNRMKYEGWHARRSAGLVLLGLLLALPCAAQSQKEQRKEADKDAASKLRIEVTGGDAAEPVDNASVYVRWERDRKFAKDQKFEQNWKTNKEGVVKVPAVPRGKILIQVIAQGWKTFGQWYEFDQDEHTVKIRLQKPVRWY